MFVGGEGYRGMKECLVETCENYDLIGSENSCSRGRYEICILRMMWQAGKLKGVLIIRDWDEEEPKVTFTRLAVLKYGAKNAKNKLRN